MDNDRLCDQHSLTRLLFTSLSSYFSSVQAMIASQC
jgi:hypothetical protein